ncbi:MAG TPA: crosslink repair DNA glycosylase YcaQ family protein [Candidatus Limnocylindrales bacterium]
METLSVSEVRRAVLAAQGFTRRAVTTATAKHVRRVVADTGLLQIDSVNVLQRAHYMPVYSRLGGYDTAVLDRASARRPRWLFEYWGHEASLLPVELHPLMRWRMAAADRIWGGPARTFEKRPDLVKWVLDEVAEKGPVTAAQIEQDERPKADQWGWRWTETKQVLEALFYFGQITSAGRTTQFARLYDLPERVLPAEVLNAATPPEEEAHRTLVEMAARRLAVAAEIELRDYFRLPVGAARTAIHQLQEAGVLVPVQVDGWKVKAWRHRDTAVPRTARVSTLVNPFDPLIWQRDRTERLFGLNYRIEIYVPQAKRVHGYYVLPFLHGDRFAARVDLKADRRAGVLRVPAAWAEPGARKPETAEALAAELQRLASWLGLSAISPADQGDLAKHLNAAL